MVGLIPMPSYIQFILFLCISCQLNFFYLFELGQRVQLKRGDHEILETRLMRLITQFHPSYFYHSNSIRVVTIIPVI